MKNLLIAILFAFCSIAAFGQEESNVYFRTLTQDESTLVQQVFNTKYFEDSRFVIKIKIGDDMIKFEAIASLWNEDGSICIVGRSNTGINIICVDGGRISIPTSAQRALVIEQPESIRLIMSDIQELPIL